MAGSVLEQDGDDDVIAQINVIPFVDIVLVLLIIFLLTANIIAKESIQVDLPKAANAGDVVGPTINIVVTASGALFVDGAPVEPGGLAARVEKDFKADSRLRAVVAADRAVRYERVIEVIDTVKQVGVTAFALNIERAGH